MQASVGSRFWNSGPHGQGFLPESSPRPGDRFRGPGGSAVRPPGVGWIVLALCWGLMAGCSPAPSAPSGSGAAGGKSGPVEPLPTIPEQFEPEPEEDPEGMVDELAEPAPTDEEGADADESENLNEPDAAEPVDEAANDAALEPEVSIDTVPDAGENPEDPEESEEDHSGRYEFRADHDPNGIGKFYMGREIAWVMGFAAAPWLERPEREKEEATSKLLKCLKLKPGMVVADVGAGSGVLTLPIAKRVGREGTVYAIDVQPEMLQLLAGKLRSRRVKNVKLVQGTETSPRLPPASIDLALMVDVYHEFAYPYEMMRGLSKAMKPGGRVVFVEFRMEDPNVPIKLVHKMTEAQVKLEIGLPEFHLKWKETVGTLPWQHVIVFEKQEIPASQPAAGN
ncbi:MAG: class I SAM-dependent methyltransferase [Planctomycetales bacterium]